jgi:hypothetical protein
MEVSPHLTFKKRLTDAGVTDILIVAVVPPFSDGGKMIFRVTITITSTKSVDEARKNLNDAVVLCFGVDVKTQLATTDLLAQSSSGKKRQSGTGTDYLQTTTIQSAPPNVPGPQPGQQPGQQPPSKIQGSAGSMISPFWLCSILIALLFLR